MKKMVNKRGTVLEVTEHIILKNFWEYYVIKAETNTDDVKLCYVLGFEDELGDVDMNEIKPYIMNRTKDLNSIMPAPGFNWEK